MELEKGGLWRNWVGNQSCVPTFRAQPTDEAGVIEAVREAVDRKLPLRVSGSGHSFTPVVGTGGILLSLAGMKGVQHVDAARKRVTVAAGTRIHDVGEALKQLGLSLNNQGDIDSQAIAGAFTTGTHGTGAELACLASQIAGMRIVKANGEVWEIDDHDLDMLRAA